MVVLNWLFILYDEILYTAESMSGKRLTGGDCLELMIL